MTHQRCLPTTQSELGRLHITFGPPWTTWSSNLFLPMVIVLAGATRFLSITMRRSIKITQIAN